MAKSPMTLVDMLNRSSPRIEWQEDVGNQAYRRVGNVVQRVLKIGMCWAWLITRDEDGTVLAGEFSWNYTPEDAVKGADDALQAANMTD